jgi:tryptophan-rich sensory protein
VSGDSSRLWKPVVAAGLAAMLVAALGATVTDLGPWYQSLRKPAWQPPDWLFGPVWTVIFALAAISGATGWRRLRTAASREWLIGLFALNGFLNILWSLLFFGTRRPDLAAYEVVLLFLSILVLIVFLARPAPIASWLLAPYLLWVSFAAILNWSVVALNAPF